MIYIEERVKTFLETNSGIRSFGILTVQNTFTVKGMEDEVLVRLERIRKSVKMLKCPYIELYGNYNNKSNELSVVVFNISIDYMKCICTTNRNRDFIYCKYIDKNKIKVQFYKNKENKISRQGIGYYESINEFITDIKEVQNSNCSYIFDSETAHFEFDTALYENIEVTFIDSICRELCRKQQPLTTDNINGLIDYYNNLVGQNGANLRMGVYSLFG